MTTYTPNQITDIYALPVSREGYEGTARLVDLCGVRGTLHNARLSDWWVEFEDDHGTYYKRTFHETY